MPHYADSIRLIVDLRREIGSSTSSFAACTCHTNSAKGYHLPVLVILLLLLWGVAGAPLSPLHNIASTVYSTTLVNQMTVDFNTNIIYAADSYSHVIFSLSPPFTSVTTWNYVMVAGRHGKAGVTSPTEVSPTFTDGVFDHPTGVVGWPQYAVGPYSTNAQIQAASPAASWVGLWVCDFYNHAIRFINFRRGNFVITVAGTSGIAGGKDGVGSAATLYQPRNVAWGRFLLAVVLPPMRSVQPQWTSVILWSDESGHCLRQGIPLHARTRLRLNGSATESLEDMVLNVTTFAGRCESNGSETGIAVGRRVLKGPHGVALANPFPNRSTTITAVETTTVLFVGDTENNRLVMIAPMYPIEMRFLTVLYRGIDVSGITIAKVQLGSHHNNNKEVLIASIELFTGSFTTSKYFNITTALNYSVVNRTWRNISSSWSSLASNGMVCTRHVAMIPHNEGGGSSTPGTNPGLLLLFTGVEASNNDPAMMYYCCLAGYSAYLPVDTDSNAYPSPSWSITRSHSVSHSMSPSSTSSWTPSAISSSGTTSMSPSRKLVLTATTTAPSFVQSGSMTASVHFLSVSVTKSSRYRSTGSKSIGFGNATATAGQTVSRSSSSSRLVSPTQSPPPSIHSASSSPSHSTPTLTSTPIYRMSSSTTTCSSTLRRPARVRSSSRPVLARLKSVSRSTFMQLEVTLVSPDIRTSIATVTSLSSAAAGGAVATALATMGLAERCLIPLENETAKELPFPASVLPWWRIGESVEYPNLPYYRAAAVGSLLAHVAATILGGVAAAGLYTVGLMAKPKWYVTILHRLPVSAVMAIDGLLLDGGVGGGATAVHLRGSSELGFLVCGLLGPVATTVGVGAIAVLRKATYHAQGLLEGASSEKRQALLARQSTPLGRLHRWVVGIGAWRDVEGMGRLGVAAYGKYRGPRDAAASWRIRACPMFFVTTTVVNVLISASRAAASPTSCVLPSAVVACLCTLMAVAFIALRPLTSVVKNGVGGFLAVYALVNAWVLLAAAVQGSPALIRIALTMAECQALLSGVSALVTTGSFLLAQWASRTRSGTTTASEKGNDGLMQALLLDEEEFDAIANVEMTLELDTTQEAPSTDVVAALLADDDDDDDNAPDAPSDEAAPVPTADPVVVVPPPPPPPDNTSRPAMPLSALADLRFSGSVDSS